MHSLRLLFDVLPELLVEQRALPGAGRAAAGDTMGEGFARRGHRRAPRQSRGSVPALPLPHHHELRQGLPEEPQSFRGDRRTQAEDGRAADLTPAHRPTRRLAKLPRSEPAWVVLHGPELVDENPLILAVVDWHGD